MNFYKRFPGDITIKTGDLTLAEFGAYDRLLDHYYATEKPLPRDLERCHLIARATNDDERAAVDYVLRTLFDRGLLGYVPQLTEGELQEGNRWRRLLDVSQGEWTRLRARVFERDAGLCAYCGTCPDVPDCDHIVPLEKGGRTTMENLTTSCPSCNRSKGSKTLAEWRP